LERVVVLGASNKAERYSYQIIPLLKSQGYLVFPVNPFLKEIEGIPVFASLKDIQQKPDTITIYLSEGNSEKMADAILNSGAKRLIFNPGAENQDLMKKAREKGMQVMQACSLTMLLTGQFGLQPE